MVDHLLYIVVLVVGFTSSNIVSLYSLAVYIDPDEVRTLMPGASKKRRAMLERLASDPRAFVHVSSVYRSLVAIILSGATVRFVSDLGGQWWPPVIPASLLGLWILYIYSVEYLPRRSARRAMNHRIFRYLWLITITYYLMLPIIKLYRGAISRVTPERQVTEEEKEEIVERAIETLADQAGIGEHLVEPEEKEMIGHIFQLDQTLVREIMSPRLDFAAIERNTSIGEIQELVRRDGHSRYPVYEGTIDKIIGILYVKDLFSNLPSAVEEFVIADYVRPAYFIPESMVIGDLQREFRKRRLHIAIVVDEYGGVAGLVTLEDILEEIVGEIQDEHDSEEAEIVRKGENTHQIDASLRIERLQEILDTDYEKPESETVGGLIYHLVGNVPEPGTTVSWHDIRFQVLEVEGQRIRSVEIYFRSQDPG